MNIDNNEESRKLCNQNHEQDNALNIHTHTHDNCNHDHSSQHRDHQNLMVIKDDGDQASQLFCYILNTNEFKYAAIIGTAYFFLAFSAFYTGLQSASVHQTEESFDCVLNGIMIWFLLYCGAKAKSFQANQSYPFGMERLEYLSTFTVCIHIIMMTLVHFSRNVHEIFEDLKILEGIIQLHDDHESHSSFYLLIRIGIAFVGVFLFIEYIQEGIHNQLDGDQTKSTYVMQYKQYLGKKTDKMYFTHYLNMHALAQLFLAELLLNLGSFLELMLDNVVEFAAIGTIIATCAMIIIYLQLKPMLYQSTFALLLASNEEYYQTRTEISQLVDQFEMFLYNNGDMYDAIVVATASKGNNLHVRQNIKEIIENKFRNTHIYVKTH